MGQALCCRPKREERTTVWWTEEQERRLLRLGALAGTPGFVLKYASQDPAAVDWAAAEDEATAIDAAWQQRGVDLLSEYWVRDRRYHGP